MSNKVLAQAIIDAIERYADEYNPMEDVPNQTISDMASIAETMDCAAERIMNKPNAGADVRQAMIIVRAKMNRLCLDLERRVDNGLKRIFRKRP